MKNVWVCKNVYHFSSHIFNFIFLQFGIARSTLTVTTGSSLGMKKNSIPPGALDNEIFERVKQRCKEKKKREMERRQAVAIKLQALEGKFHSKRADVSEGSDNATIASSVTQEGGKLDVKATARHVYETRERYDKYERGGSGIVERGVDPSDRNIQSSSPQQFQHQ